MFVIAANQQRWPTTTLRAPKLGEASLLRRLLPFSLKRRNASAAKAPRIISIGEPRFDEAQSLQAFMNDRERRGQLVECYTAAFALAKREGFTGYDKQKRRRFYVY